MKNYSLDDLNEKYDLELDRVISEIKKIKAKLVLLQFPDGLKPYSTVILDYLQDKIKDVNFFIWLGSCFGACDIPKIDEKDFDMIIQFGHSKWDYNSESGIEVLK